jgi:hypothetical protein
MSFAEQERVLFDLLFDRELRERFCQAPESALAAYTLSESERADFNSVRPDALQLDAFMRSELILTHLSKSYPLSFSMQSSLTDGIETLRQLVDRQTMRHAPVARAAAFGARLRESIAVRRFDNELEKSQFMAILEAELGMATSGASLKQWVLDNGQAPRPQSVSTEEWLQQPVRLADYLSASIIPQSYGLLKNSLCPCDDSALWQQITHTPLPVSVRREAFEQEQPRLLVTRAVVSRVSACEPVIDFQTVELSEGFAPLFEHLDGHSSVQQLLGELEKIGAPAAILQGVQAGFQQLLTLGMLVPV